MPPQLNKQPESVTAYFKFSLWITKDAFMTVKKTMKITLFCLQKCPSFAAVYKTHKRRNFSAFCGDNQSRAR